MGINVFTLITGASQGIGEALANSFAQRGHNIILTARNRDALEEVGRSLEKKYGIKVEIIVQDLSEPASAESLFLAIASRGLSLKGIVNNAGFGYLGEFSSHPSKEVTEMIQVNVTSLTAICHLFLNSKSGQKGGWILNVASVAAFVPGPMMSQYYASKAYVLNFTAALHEELKNRAINTCCLCPGPTVTGFGTRARVGDSLMFKLLPQLSPAQVAELGYLGLMKNKPIVIAGKVNWLIAKLNLLIPLRLSNFILKYIHSSL